MARLESALVALIALIALGAALIWLVSAYRGWPVYQVERLLLKNAPVATPILEKALTQAAALPHHFLPEKRLHAHALFAIHYAYRPETPRARRRQILQEARSIAQHALACDPANGYAWARLAYLHQALDGPSPAVADALRLSAYTAPNTLSLKRWRHNLARRNRADAPSY